jgi:hypothetical protein
MRRIVTAAGLLLTVAGCSWTSTTPSSTLSTATRTQAGVTVRVGVMGQGSAGWRLKVLLVPLSQGFHLYSLSLPDGGEQGLGIPTRQCRESRSTWSVLESPTWSWHRAVATSSSPAESNRHTSTS